jgi:two-component system, LytTR family, response regulator
LSFRTLIVEDEPVARRRIKRLLAGDPEVEVVGECGDGREAVAAIRRLAPDLLFLDVQMPERDGFGVLEALSGEWLPAIIFVTAYDSHALKAFEVNALDYLLKPFDRERFQKALDRAKESIRDRQGRDLNRRLLSLMQSVKPEAQYLERLVVKSAGDILFLRVEDVDWIEPAGNYLRLHVKREVHLLRETMSGLESKLEPKQFIRIQRSVIVNVRRIKKLHPLFRGEYVVVLQDGTRLTSSRGYRQGLDELLGKTP